jgi:hypothetical protein
MSACRANPDGAGDPGVIRQFVGHGVADLLPPPLQVQVPNSPPETTVLLVF